MRRGSFANHVMEEHTDGTQAWRARAVRAIIQLQSIEEEKAATQAIHSLSDVITSAVDDLLAATPDQEQNEKLRAIIMNAVLFSWELKTQHAIIEAVYPGDGHFKDLAYVQCYHGKTLDQDFDISICVAPALVKWKYDRHHKVRENYCCRSRQS